jgi:hypothetical protein
MKHLDENSIAYISEYISGLVEEEPPEEEIAHLRGCMDCKLTILEVAEIIAQTENKNQERNPSSP